MARNERGPAAAKEDTQAEAKEKKKSIWWPSLRLLPAPDGGIPSRRAAAPIPPLAARAVAAAPYRLGVGVEGGREGGGGGCEGEKGR